MIAGPYSVDLYAWDERTAKKGADEVFTCVRQFIVAEKKQNPEATHFIFWSDGCNGQAWNQFAPRFAHEICEPTSQIYVPGVKRVEFKRAPKGHSYLWCDRVLGPIKAHAQQVQHGIWAGLATKDLPQEFREKTWEYCIGKARLNGGKYILHKMKQVDFDGYKSLFESHGSVLTQGTMHFVDPDSHQKLGEFLIRDLNWIVAGVGAFKYSASAVSDRGRNVGYVWCKSGFKSDSFWKKLPLLRPAFKPHKDSLRPPQTQVTTENLETERKHEPKLESLKPHIAPYPISAEKKADLEKLAAQLVGTEHDLVKVFRNMLCRPKTAARPARGGDNE